MMTRAEQLKAGISQADIDRTERTQKVYDYALQLIKELAPNAPGYLQAAMTRELLLRATGDR